MFNINILFPGQDLPFTLKVPSDSTVQQIIDLLPKTKIPKENIRILFLGKILKPTDKLNKVGVQDGYTMHVIEYRPPPADASTGDDHNSSQYNNFRFVHDPPQNEDNLQLQCEFRRLIVVLQQTIAAQQRDLLTMKILLDDPNNKSQFLDLQKKTEKRLQIIQKLVNLVSSFQIKRANDAVLVEFQTGRPDPSLRLCLNPEEYSEVIQDERLIFISNGNLHSDITMPFFQKIIDH